MRAFVVTGPGTAGVEQVEEPVAGPGEVVVAVERAGVCGTDAEFYSGHMTYLHTGQAAYPVRIGHEWCGTVTAVGAGVDPAWRGRRVTGDTMLGCGRCRRCRGGRQHLCADRYEIGIRNGWPGALAERLPVPEKALVPLPGSVDATLGALVEPGANALRAVRAAELSRGDRLLVAGPGTIGLLTALIAAAQGAEVHVLGETTDFARRVGVERAWTAADVPGLRWDAVIDASNGSGIPARAVELVEPGGRVVFIGLAARPSPVDTRELVLKDVTAVGVLSGSGALAGTAGLYASGAVDPRPLVAATVALADAGAVLAGERRPEWGPAPKIHIDPSRG
ncbi:alcohol dehydrogenase [Actinoplanes sp. NBRC 14428]|uniref:Threonine dehydrogenase-like Zn-dependent dehydrogenase n=1 Tax=Pseudosporangium ferrugineum TaxID=439699 RepID=A0A2T0SJ19_9ACTN|nr:alcohol dehydrogenase catalytic domain-containing protein [Pseudosporangium ferrugineum]PRY33410.1 threonine dehydrogenase-like Zn-dependent dehydrogenase [Pseudosporangium ferrugineum]BCJ48591.1 alcohol dehydrogenase [Actinoplanes sp. NBRC 14428]